MNAKVIEIFKLHVYPEPNTGCWLWGGSVFSSKEYGCFMYKGVNYSAHRLSYTIYKGEIPEGLSILHKCDMPACCNPDHLFAGTKAENCKDRANKGRSAVGERNGQSRIKNHQIPIILSLRSNRMKMSVIARTLGISEYSIRAIFSGKTWNHLTGIPKHKKQPIYPRVKKGLKNIKD